jgi:aminoglycoside phosphotransferase (APT) family kinase protein
MDEAAGSSAAPEWAAEQVVGTEQARDLIGAQFPFLRGAPVELLAEGWDNTVYAVDDRWAFRFPRRAVALPGVRREVEVLPRLARHLPMPIPFPELVGTGTPGYPWPFWGTRLLPGRELALAGLADKARAHVAAGVGAFLRSLHAAELVRAIGPALPVDPLRRGDPSFRVPLARERLARLERRRLWRPDPAVERLLSGAEGLGLSPDDPVLVHGDLHVRHLLVSEGGHVTGVIDWGDVCLADPAVDLSLAFAAFAGDARAAFFAEYGPIDGEREARARVLAVFLSSALVDYAASEGHAQLLREALDGIRRAATP